MIQDASVPEKHILERYGGVARWNGPLGVFWSVTLDLRDFHCILRQEDRLWVADPKAINHVLKNSCTVYRKLEGTREIQAMVFDRGLTWADGNII